MFEEDPELRLDQLVDGRFFHHLLLQVDPEYFRDTMISATSSEGFGNNWVLNAARLKRTYLRLLSHYSLVLGRDPTKLAVPDFNQVAMRRHREWPAHLVRMAGIVMFAAAESPRPGLAGGFRAPNEGWFQRYLERLDPQSASTIHRFLANVRPWAALLRFGW